jgi:hypothetical protein
MLIFLDTEFTDFAQPELISIGLATTSGPDFYAERDDYPRERCTPFVIDEVIPLLGRVPNAACDASELTNRLRDWFEQLPEPAIVLYDFETDWTLLCNACGGELPAKVGAHQLVDQKIFRHSAYRLGEVLTYKETWPPHHALADAQALREGYLRWRLATEGERWNSHGELTDRKHT